MRSPNEIFQDLESDRQQREGELRLIENIAARAAIEAERNMLFRSLVLLTYAHLEGFCKFALLAYAGAINSIGLRCGEASSALVAASLRKVFSALRDTNSKHPEFRNALPDDAELNLSWRERTFVEAYERIVAQHIEIPDRVVDTKANLNSVVLKRNLYQLGLNYPEVDRHRASIDMLLGVRNAIAHGDALRVPSESQVREYTSAAFDVMRFVQNEVFEALRSEAYRRASSGCEDAAAAP
ncbi:MULTISPECIES: MAE_28990/MAE_18760 family HEPN-like nuclease [unclassified Bradyrhizobium]|uniref:MAE_28990/MAE_18760 family HEPN-like nuclease n=1 Tax=unclassified Bradyrhizobium TaxID=2631580 RepID=UPI0029161B79|nr:MULTISPECIES: MAE_28990/MAE_18760 family HEPN-like nuclease [unclassified Bradyrhizobium]